MKQAIAAGLTAAALGGCAITPENAVADRVFLLNDRLTVIFSNGMQCRVGNVSQRPSGDMTGCPVPARYDIQMDRPGYFPDSLTEPYADIYIIKPDGYVKRFQKPDSRNWKEVFHEREN
ncbi:hypothetical protein [Paracoccus sp. S1E-3]|uniref:hypothetical protein n=2 Tax=Paracoccus TaxID=265 RepID=UPI0015EFB06A|nr:hypothetical protein [Paracoccus sp. S1E-3]MBA4490476.1 hypothetical protein [Paracoccus sp. S1E-3]